MDGYKLENIVRTMSVARKFRKLSPKLQRGNLSDFCQAHEVDKDAEKFQVVEVVDGVRKLRHLFVSKDTLRIAKPIYNGLEELNYHIKGTFSRNEVRNFSLAVYFTYVFH